MEGGVRPLTYCAVMNIDISLLDEAQLVELNRRIVARLKYLQEARTHHQMLRFNVGDRVSFHPPGHDPKTASSSSTTARPSPSSRTISTSGTSHRCSSAG